MLANFSVQQHIKKGVPQHQDYCINNYFDEKCNSVKVSLLWQ